MISGVADHKTLIIIINLITVFESRVGSFFGSTKREKKGQGEINLKCVTFVLCL